MKKLNPQLLIIDSFCGAGGVTEGFEQAEINREKIAMVIVGINHDKLAIESHIANHPETLHFVEDMRTLNLLPVIHPRATDGPLQILDPSFCTNGLPLW